MSPWGIFRHYWLVFKLLMTIFATGILLMYMATFRSMAATAAVPASDLAVVRNPSPLVHATLALVILLVATVLAIYKLRGLTPYGRRMERGRQPAGTVTPVGPRAQGILD